MSEPESTVQAGRDPARGPAGPSEPSISSPGNRQPAAPRDAATVMLLRSAEPSDGGIEVYMLRRKSSMAFAPRLRLPRWIGRRQGCRRAVGLGRTGHRRMGAGLRRTPGTGVRAGVRGGQGDLRGVRRAAGRAIRRTWWPTPPVPSGKRTGTRCLTARSRWPRCSVARGSCSGPTCSGRGPGGSPRWSRSAASTPGSSLPRCPGAAHPGCRRRGGRAWPWVRPGDAIAAGRRKEIMLFPPTAVTLADLASCPDVAAALRPRQVRPAAPRGDHG